MTSEGSETRAEHKQTLPFFSRERVQGLSSNKRLESGVLASRSGREGAYRVRAGGRRHNEGLGVVNHQRLECVVRAFDQDLVAFDQVEDIDATVGGVRNRPGEPMAAGLDELKLVQTCALLAPGIALGKGFNAVDEIAPGPFGVAVPLDVRQPAVEMHWSRLAVEAKARPVPQLERENVRRRAD